MRHALLLSAALLLSLPLHAEPEPSTPAPALSSSDSHSSELQAQRDALSAERARAARLERQRDELQQQLNALPVAEPALFNEQQLWYLIGIGSGLLTFLLGRLSAGGRQKKRSEWL